MARRFLLTTSRSLLVLDAQTGRIERVHAGAGLYYGIDVGDDRTYVAARRRMVSSDVPPHAERGVVLVFDRHLREREPISADFALRDMHQIRMHAGKLYVTCSYDNMVAIFDGGAWQQWYPVGEPQTEPRDINHFNTIEFIDGKLCLLAHNNGASELLLFDAETLLLDERFVLGTQAHNIWKAGEEWRVCSSAEGKLLGTRGFEVVTGGFPRGVWIGDGCALVGVSELAERQDRDFTSSAIIVYDSTWRECERIALPNEGLVLDIAALPH